MNIGRCMPLLAVLGAALLAGCGSTPPANGAAAAPTPPAPTQGSAGVKAFVDPATGELREPNETELKAAAAGTRSGTADAKATAVIEGKPIGNGVIEYEVGKRGQIDEVVCVQKDGAVTSQCPPAKQAK